jgi:ADP-ribose pyrophosphatase YjhB (NUDIX family)
MRTRLAVGAVVLRGDGAVLLVQRARPPLEGAWSLPGGKVEAGESLAEALRREVREETGLDVEPGARVAELTLLGEGFAYEIHDFACALAPHARPDDAGAGDDARAVRWWSEDALGEVELTDEVRAAIDEARRLARR